MKKPRTFKKIRKFQSDNVVYSILFKRFKRLTLITGILLLVPAVFNYPLMYNPELGDITFAITGKPSFGPFGALTTYIYIGLFPAILGLVIIFFSILTSRKIIIFMNNDGTSQYRKLWAPYLFRYSYIDFSLKEDLQSISLGKRHHRFIIWAPVAGLIYLIFLLFDHVNMLDPSFDIWVDYFDTQYSTKFFIWINTLYFIGIMLLITLFPRKLCKIDTPEAFFKFTYTKIYIEKHSEAEVPYAKPFLMLSKGYRDDAFKESIIPDYYPEVLIAHINNKDFKHIPFLLLLTNIGLFLIVFLPQLIPNFFLGPFTLRIEFFMMIAAFYFTIRTLHYNWYSGQEIQVKDRDLLIKRKNRIFGDSVEYFAGIEKIELNSTPRKPHLLEYALYLLPLVQIVWWFTMIFTFPVYFFTQNIFTILYFVVIIGIFLFTAAEYILPRSMLLVTPKAQSEIRKKIETFSIYFPSEKILKKFPLKQAREQKKFLQNSLSGFLLILIPVIIGLIWVILSIFGILPHIIYTAL